MDRQTSKFKIRLGLFIAGGCALFVVAIFIIGKQKNLFDPVYKLTAYFKNVSGLQVGSNIRFSGIDVGTVDNIEIINDSTVQVDLLIRKDVQKFIRADCLAGIGSSGLIGDRILVITQGSSDAALSKDGQDIASKEPIEMDGIMASLQVTAYNAEIISYQAAEIVSKINDGEGIVGKLFQDTSMANNISDAILSIKKSGESLDENMEAAQHNFLLRPFFRKKENEAKAVKDSIAQSKEEEMKAMKGGEISDLNEKEKTEKAK